MHRFPKILLGALALAVAAVPAMGQRRVVVEGPPEGGFRLLLPGMLIFLSSDEEASEVKVARRIQFQDELPEEYSGLDLKEGDVIAMADGQPIISSEDFKKIYEKAEVGAEIALGVRRGEEVMVLGLIKPDPASLPRMRIQAGDEGGEHGVQIRREAPKKEKKKEQKPPK